GGGEFLINGNERVIVGQLQRAPGIDFFAPDEGEGISFSCRILPLRGTRVDLYVNRYGTLEAAFSPGVHLPAFTLLRALDDRLSRDVELIPCLHPVRSLDLSDPHAPGSVVVEEQIHPRTGEILLEPGSRLCEATIARL